MGPYSSLKLINKINNNTNNTKIMKNVKKYIYLWKTQVLDRNLIVTEYYLSFCLLLLSIYFWPNACAPLDRGCHGNLNNVPDTQRGPDLLISHSFKSKLICLMIWLIMSTRNAKPCPTTEPKAQKGAKKAGELCYWLGPAYRLQHILWPLTRIHCDEDDRVDWHRNNNVVVC